MGPWNSRGNPTASACTSSADSWTCPGSPAARSSWPSPFTQSETRDLALLSDKGWSLVDPQIVAGDPLSYRSYIGRSRAEFSVAKDMYVQTRGGWISDRSLCYLASGKPVLAQETGFSRHYPTGEGLLAYSTLEEAVAGVEEITRRPDRHARAARALAEEYFDSDKVLARLLQKLGVA